jgi:phosphoglycerate dehydrogenase-like enzyme
MPGSALADYDALILVVPLFSRQSIPANRRLGLVARFGVGFDNVDLDACNEAGIAVVTTPHGIRRPLAVAIITFILALTSKLMVKDRLTRQGPDGFNQRASHMGVGLVGRVLGSVGIGNIGAEMFRLAKPFDMRYIAHDPYASAEVAKELGVELVDLETVFRISDIVTLNCPLTAETRHIVNARTLRLMKPSAYLINTARGPVVDQVALTDALEKGLIAGAGLDVFDTEPPPADEPILRLDNVIVAPRNWGRRHQGRARFSPGRRSCVGGKPSGASDECLDAAPDRPTEFVSEIRIGLTGRVDRLVFARARRGGLSMHPRWVEFRRPRLRADAAMATRP